jgi:hypothetical protein
MITLTRVITNAHAARYSVDVSRDFRARAHAVVSSFGTDDVPTLYCIIVGTIEGALARMRSVGTSVAYLAIDAYHEVTLIEETELKELEQARRAGKVEGEADRLAFVDRSTPIEGGVQRLKELMSVSANKRHIYSFMWRCVAELAPSLLHEGESIVWAGDLSNLPELYTADTPVTNRWTRDGPAEKVAILDNLAPEADQLFGPVIKYHSTLGDDAWVIADVDDADVRVTTTGKHAIAYLEGEKGASVFIRDSSSKSVCRVWSIALVADGFRAELGDTAAWFLLKCATPVYFLSGCDYTGKIAGYVMLSPSV